MEDCFVVTTWSGGGANDAAGDAARSAPETESKA